jgi:hypothetical protein
MALAQRLDKLEAAWRAPMTGRTAEFQDLAEWRAAQELPEAEFAVRYPLAHARRLAAREAERLAGVAEV